jgi:hypothetical protein
MRMLIETFKQECKEGMPPEYTENEIEPSLWRESMRDKEIYVEKLQKVKFNEVYEEELSGKPLNIQVSERY